MSIRRFLITLIVFILVSLLIIIVVSRVLDIPTVYISISTGQVSVMTSNSYPNKTVITNECEIPDKYNLIWIK